MEIFYEILSIPQNIIMDLNNVMALNYSQLHLFTLNYFECEYVNLIHFINLELNVHNTMIGENRQLVTNEPVEFEK